MSLKFRCSDCGNDIVVRFLDVGEEAECKNCRTKQVVPATATQTDERPVYHATTNRAETRGDTPSQERGGGAGSVMTDHSLSVGAWLALGWVTYKEHKRALVLGYVPLLVLALIDRRLEQEEVDSFHMVLPGILLYLLSDLMYVGFYSLCLKALRDERASAAAVFDGFSYIGPAVLTSILYSLIVFAGALLLIVPGIVWALKYSMWWFAVTDRRLSGRKALRFSGNITKGYKGKISVILILAGVPGAAASILVGLPAFVPFLTPGAASFLILWTHILQLVVFGPWLGATFATACESLSLNAEAATAAEVVPEGSAEASDEQPL